jgi:hypothetical protein
MRRRFGARFAQRISLRFSAAFGHGFGKIRKQHREPQPQSNLQAKSKRAGVAQGVSH